MELIACLWGLIKSSNFPPGYCLEDGSKLALSQLAEQPLLLVVGWAGEMNRWLAMSSSPQAGEVL